MEYIENLNLHDVIISLYIIVGVSFMAYILFFFIIDIRIYRRTLKTSNEGKRRYDDKQIPLSVIVTARNQRQNLEELLPILLTQDYEEYEVIVVNDGSTDDTEELLYSLSNKYRNLYHTFSPSNTRRISNKKLAVTLGIKASKYDWVVFTEANCRPVSNQWIKTIAQNFTEKTDVVIGASIYENNKGWRNRFISFDKLTHTLKYVGFALAGKPYMALGKNMAYRKQCFYDEKGYSKYLHLLRGEDDLFINQIAKANNTLVEISPNSVVVEKEYKTKREWFQERISYISTSALHKGCHKAISILKNANTLILTVSCLVGLVASIIHREWILMSVCTFVIMFSYFAYMFMINKTAKSMNMSKRYYFSLPILNFQLAITNIKHRIYYLTRNKKEFTRKSI